MIENWRLKYVITQNHAACVILTHHAASMRDLANIAIIALRARSETSEMAVLLGEAW